MISDVIMQRKGALKVSEIPEEVSALLQSGQLESVNLTEWLAVNHIVLLDHIVNELDLKQQAGSMVDELQQGAEKKIMKIIPAIAQAWLSLMERLPSESRELIFMKLSTHLSDSVRCWAAYIVGLDRKLSLDQKLTHIRSFAADSHFGVREIAWMAVRESISNELELSIRILSDWVHDANDYVRRFAIEATRPHGVWAKHISALKNKPGLALVLLEAVKSDPVKYVQDSVGNWLNDAGKSNPEWVQKVCKTWSVTSDTKDTRRIIKRALRSFPPPIH
ncbi:DNA alkylation repair protein [Cohnella herbarum]|uniref:DNA alkylation repair protein n=1 Tax=Cohnella herbarum TaxID=2728023 RepID=UPI0020C34228|nr:DNA alkylation repair protein [Cohnella herbarum]